MGPPRLHLLTLVRDPFDRLLSEFFFVRTACDGKDRGMNKWLRLYPLNLQRAICVGDFEAFATVRLLPLLPLMFLFCPPLLRSDFNHHHNHEPPPLPPPLPPRSTTTTTTTTTTATTMHHHYHHHHHHNHHHHHALTTYYHHSQSPLTTTHFHC
jgi:hypothetical protein